MQGPIYIHTHIYIFLLEAEGSFPRGSESKESACNAGDLGLILGLGRSPWSRKWQPTPVFLPGKFHEQKTLVGYSSWGHGESDTTEHTHTAYIK